MNRIIFAILPVIIVSLSCLAAETEYNWFPEQKPPRTVAILTVDNGFNAEHMLAQSLSGLAALAVNEGRFDEMIWIQTPLRDYAQWYRGVKTRLGFRESGTYSVWELIENYKTKGVFEGYVLYRYDASEGEPWADRENVDQSVNVATALAGVLKGLLIDESLEAKAISSGLVQLADVRDKDLFWCYKNYSGKLNHNMLLTVDPKSPLNRDYAIAHRCAAVYGVGQDTETFCKWLEPPAPILGWNCGDEMAQTSLVTEYGHFQTATNWSLNLPLLSAQKKETAVSRVPSFDKTKILKSDSRYPVAMMISDGDNIQWMTNNFFFSKDYWRNDSHGRFPFNWTFCPSHLIQIAPDIYNYMVKTKPANSTVIEYGAGYYYPDIFGVKRPDRKKILTLRAQQISCQLKRTGVNILGFICKDIHSAGAKEAYEIYAREIEGLIGMVAFQYYPYNAGMGEIFWVSNKDGIDIPVITATHSMWQNAYWENGGDPFKTAQSINDYAAGGGSGVPDYALVISHSWSYFGKKQDLENKHRGLSPVQWCVSDIGNRATIISLEELMWRIRMKYRPEQTHKIFNN